MATCISCGYLCLRHRASRELREVEIDIRGNGEIPTELVKGEGYPSIYEQRLICFVQAFPLEEEVLINSGSIGRPKAFLHVFRTNRICEKHVQWQQGFTPKEHAEMLQQEALQQWQEGQAAASRRHNWLALAVAVVAVLASIISPYIAPRQPAPVVNISPPQVNVAPPEVHVTIPAKAEGTK